jgi:hypothetical protein
VAKKGFKNKKNSVRELKIQAKFSHDLGAPLEKV